jgi:hypothetical protein
MQSFVTSDQLVHVVMTVLWTAKYAAKSRDVPVWGWWMPKECNVYMNAAGWDDVSLLLPSALTRMTRRGTIAATVHISKTTDLKTRVWVPAEAEITVFQTSSGAHPASHHIDNEGCFTACKAAKGSSLDVKNRWNSTSTLSVSSWRGA